MSWVIHMTDTLFSLALIINAVLFFLQFLKIIRRRCADDLSIPTFLGFWLIQLVTISYGYLHNVPLLAYGTALSLLSSSLVIGAIVFIKIRGNNELTKYSGPDLNEIIALMPGNVYWIDRKGRFLGCNNNMLKLLGLKSVDEYRGKTYEDMYERTHIQIIKQTDEYVMSSNQAVSLEETAVPRRIYWTQKRPLHNRWGKVIGLLGISVDITERKDAEIALEHEKQKAQVANMAKTQFVYDMRHDLRTPLLNVIGLGRILLDQEINQTKKLITQDIVTSSEALLKLLNEMLDFSNIEEGVYAIRQVRFDLKNLADDITSMMTAAISHKGIDFNIFYKDGFPSSVMGDRMRIHRILLNLISNAVRYTSDGEVRVEFDAIHYHDRRAMINVKIKDTGIGILADKVNAIFDRFYRVEPASSGSSGLGLGLALVRQFLNDIGGHVRVESELNVGSTFYCTFPVDLPLGSEQYDDSGQQKQDQYQPQQRHEGDGDSRKLTVIEEA